MFIDLTHNQYDFFSITLTTQLFKQKNSNNSYENTVP